MGMEFRTKFQAGEFLVWYHTSDASAVVSVWIERFRDKEIITGKRFFVAKKIWHGDIFSAAIKDPKFIRDKIWILKEMSTITEAENNVKIKSVCDTGLEEEETVYIGGRGNGKTRLCLIQTLKRHGFDDDAIDKLFTEFGYY